MRSFAIVALIGVAAAVPNYISMTESALPTTVYQTDVSYVTACASDVEDCPLTTTTSCEDETSSYTMPTVAPVEMSTHIVYATHIETITDCPETVTYCPAESVHVKTVTVAVSTTICPASEIPTYMPHVETSSYMAPHIEPTYVAPHVESTYVAPHVEMPTHTIEFVAPHVEATKAPIYPATSVYYPISYGTALPTYVAPVGTGTAIVVPQPTQTPFLGAASNVQAGVVVAGLGAVVALLL